MFDELNKYQLTNHFFFSPHESLGAVCNAPTTKSGIYIVYALSHGKIELVYVGRSGKANPEGSIFVRKAGLGGIKDRIVNGHQFGKIPRRKSWPAQMSKEDIEALDVYWYVTHNEECNDCPRLVESTLLQKHLALYGRLPRWNNAL